MRVLVTGGSGFVGSHLIERLRERGDEVVSLAKEAANRELLAGLGVETVIGDLNNGIDPVPLLDRVEVVFHLAGVTRARATDDYYEGNHRATKRLIEHCIRHGRSVRRFVYVSSQAAAGPSLDGRPVDERIPCRPVSHYGRSKMLAEKEVLAARDRSARDDRASFGGLRSARPRLLQVLPDDPAARGDSSSVAAGAA